MAAQTAASAPTALDAGKHFGADRAGRLTRLADGAVKSLR
jgi:hypothetical protein